MKEPNKETYRLMKAFVLTTGLLISGWLNAQNYTRDAGIRLGDHFSAMYRQFSNDDEAVEGMVFVGNGGMTFAVMKEFFQPALGQISENLFFEYGFGSHIGFRYTDHYKVLNRTYWLEDHHFTPLLGIDGILGVEYRFPDLPVCLSVDIKPYFEFSTIQVFNIYLQSVGVSLKYRF
jgi:hypothetical protein